jgi:hypothetical protein
MSRIPRFLDNRLRDGGEVVSRMCWSLFTLRKIPVTDFYYRPSQPQDHNAVGCFRKM